MFDLSKGVLTSLKNAIQPEWQPAMSGGNLVYFSACAGGSCKGTCGNTCKGTCHRGCKGVGKGS